MDNPVYSHERICSNKRQLKLMNIEYNKHLFGEMSNKGPKFYKLKFPNL